MHLEREHSLSVWNAAVQRSMGWTDVYNSEE